MKIKEFVNKNIGVYGLAIGLAFLSACSEQTPMPEGLLFSGDCSVEVEALPRGAEIVLDGIPVGKNKIAVELPCGEKRLVVKQKGYRPYYAYHNVSKDQMLRVSVSLDPLPKGSGSFALSRDIVDQIREGLPVWDTSKGPRPEVAEGSFPSYMGDMDALIASVKGAGASTDEAAGAAFEQGVWDSVEDWR